MPYVEGTSLFASQVLNPQNDTSEHVSTQGMGHMSNDVREYKEKRLYFKRWTSTCARRDNDLRGSKRRIQATPEAATRGTHKKMSCFLFAYLDRLWPRPRLLGTHPANSGKTPKPESNIKLNYIFAGAQTWVLENATAC